MTTLDIPTYKPQVIDLPANKSLQSIARSVAPLDQDELLPIENLNGLEPGELDTSILNVTYFDEKLQMTLPLFACSSVDNTTGGCDLYIKYESRFREGWDRVKESFGNSVDIRMKNLAKHLPEKPVKIEEYIGFLRRNKEDVMSGVRNMDKATTCLIAFWVSIITIAACMAGIASGVEAVPQAVFAIGAILGGIGMISTMGMAMGHNNGPVKEIINRFNTMLRCPFPGKIPQRIRDIVKSSRKDYEDIHMVWEAKDQWVVEQHSSEVEERIIPQPPDPDPIIFGEKNGKFYYLACFDVTPRESTILGEFIG
jgi:hypothetical protein